MRGVGRLKQDEPPVNPPPELVPGPAGTLRRMLWGAATGLLFAAMALLVGAIRISIALAGGRHISFDELHVLAYYLGGFIVAGGAAGVLWPLTRTTIGRSVIGVLGAGVMFGIFMLGIRGFPGTWTGAEWFSWSVCTLFFGGILGRSLRTWREAVS